MTSSSFRRLMPSVRCTLAFGLLGVGAAGLLLGLAGWRRVADARETRALWAVLGTADAWSPWMRQDVEAALWHLSEASPNVKREILAASLRRESSSGDQPLRTAVVFHAAVGLNPDGLALLLDLFRSQCGADSRRKPSSRTACSCLSEELPPRIRGGYLVRAIAASADVAEIQLLAESLRRTGTDSTQARQHITRLLAASPPASALPLLQALDALGAELPPREADRALDFLSSRAVYEDERERRLLGRVVQRASPAAVARARARFLASLHADTSDTGRRARARVFVLKALGQELPPADAAVIASKVLTRFRAQGSREPWRSSVGRTFTLIRTFEMLHRDVPAEFLESSAREILSRCGEPDARSAFEVPLFFRPIWAKLPPAWAKDFRTENMERLLTAEEPSEVFCLGAVLATWPDLPPGDALAAWRPFRTGAVPHPPRLGKGEVDLHRPERGAK